ncbi:FAD-dependent oxidoreductase [Microlunatus sp. Gsoil 973]|uniref:FAD-dependent oxidoreductase n=1 Tax=Microlunatus sp. Gsoil 973 TaxID=2672569 RepID=UPI0012B4F6C2|nr:FAD-dependent oxidoreductase [Microlunatus sp. Gsoil 973]QGN34695.1 NAD(P)/FAD-dependent oxidoreductase [Microlunatus sp. Gsoil 973]
MLQQRRRRARRVVVIGFGPVAARLVEELRPAVRDHRLQLLVVGSEPDPAYNRIMIGELALGRTDRELMIMADPEQLAADGVRLRLGTSVTAIDRERRYVTLDDGDEFAYDALVFATGAAARVPRLAGLAVQDSGEDARLPDGVAVLRDLSDADRVAAIVGAGRNVIILGGGVLGMEFALAAAGSGVRTSLVHTGRVPMERNLDQTAAAIVSRHLRRQDVTVIAQARAQGLRLTQGRFVGLQLADGREISGDGLVLCCGAEPRTGLARRAGISCHNGILVDHDLRSISDRSIFAIGDCARIRCADENCAGCRAADAPSGLIGPGWAQASRVARQLADPDDGRLTTNAPDEGGPVLTVKASGLSVVSAGAVDADPLDSLLQDGELRVAQWSDPELSRYAKMITRDGRLEGLICVGLPRAAAELTLLYERRAELPSDRSALLRHDGPDQAMGTDPLGPEATVCRCAGVSAAEIVAAIGEGNADLAAVGRATRAGTGCGTCKDRICELLRNTPEVAVA